MFGNYKKAFTGTPVEIPHLPAITGRGQGKWN
jgi:hypothetical protein